MTSSIEKFLKKLSAKDKAVIQELLEKITARTIDTADVKKLAGYKDVFRIRKGKFRIVFTMNDSDTRVILVEKRKDDTYSL